MNCCASHQLPSVCFRFDLVEIKHMQNKNANTVVCFVQVSKVMQTTQNFQKPTLTNLENVLLPVPLLNCALSGDRTKPLNLPCTNSLGTSCLSSFLGDSCSATCSSHSCQDCLSKFLSVGSCLDPVHVHHTCMLHAIARSKTFRQNITKP